MTSKLHLPGPGLKPRCGRQLQNNRQGRAQFTQDRQFAADGAEYLKALLDGKACRHCGYRSGVLVREIVRYVNSDDSDEQDGLED